MQDPYPIPWENKGKCLGQSLWLPPETLDIVSQRGVHRGQDTEGNSLLAKMFRGKGGHLGFSLA